MIIMMKKVIICSVIIVCTCILGFLFFRSRNSTSLEIVRISELIDQEEQEFDSAVGESTINEKAADDKKYDIVKRIEEVSEINIKNYNEKDGTATCEIKAPNLYTYVMDNLDDISAQSDEEAYLGIIEYLNSGDYATKVTEITAYATIEDNKLIIDDTSFEFQDAFHGGINSLMTDLVIFGLNEIAEVEGK